MRKFAAILLCVLLLAGCTPAGDRYATMNTRPDYTEPNWYASSEATQESESVQATSPWEDILTYAEYLEMSSQERDVFYKSFESVDDFFTWLRETKAVYDARREENQLGQGGSIDMGDIDPSHGED